VLDRGSPHMMRDKVDTRSEERKEIVLGAELGGLDTTASMSAIGMLRQPSFRDTANSMAFIDLPVSQT
jgi:hypothetical protein